MKINNTKNKINLKNKKIFKKNKIKVIDELKYQKFYSEMRLLNKK